MNVPAAENSFVNVRAALFDLDGTLIETHIDFPRMKQRTLELAADYGFRPESLASLDILSIVESVRESLEKRCGTTDAARWRVAAFAMLQEIEIAECARPNRIPGAAELLSALRSRGIGLGVVTRNCRVVAERLLAAGDLCCDILLTRDDVLRTKPDPAHLLTALERLGVQAFRPSGVQGGKPNSRTPERLNACVMVGDHPMDVLAGRAAGMRTIGVLHGQPCERFVTCMPDLLVDKISDLLRWTETTSQPGN